MKKWLKKVIGEVVTDLLGKFTLIVREIVTDLFDKFKLTMREVVADLFDKFIEKLENFVEKKSLPVEVFTRLSADDVVRHGEALDELAQGPHYKYLVELVKRRRAQVGEAALAGGGHSIEYWKGFRDGAESLEMLVDPMRKNAQALIEEHKEGGASLKEFLGVGDGPLT